MSNPFFKNCGPFKISKILELFSLNKVNIVDKEIHDIKQT